MGHEPIEPEESEITNNAISETIDALYRNLVNSENNDYLASYEALFPSHEFDENNPISPTVFQRKMREHDRKKSTYARMTVESLGYPRDTAWKAEKVFSDYSGIGWFMRTLIDKFEGSACCADKSRWLINYYLNGLKGESSLPSVQGWNQVNLSTLQLWVKTIDAFISFNQGADIRTLPALLQELEDFYMELNP